MQKPEEAVTSHGKSIEDAETKVARSSEKRGKAEQAVAASQEKLRALGERQRFTARKGTGGATREKEFGGFKKSELEAFAQDAELMGGEKLRIQDFGKGPKRSENFQKAVLKRVQEAEEKERKRLKTKTKK